MEYKDYFSVDFKAVDHSDFYKLEEKMFSKLKDCMENNHFEEALEIAEQIEYECVQNNNLLYTINMLEIYKEEKKHGVRTDFFGDAKNWKTWRGKYDTVKFEIRYVELFASPDQIRGFMEMINCGEISKSAVQVISKHSSIMPGRWNEI